MGIELKTVIPWGRSFDEYADMFLLSDEDLKKKILGCGDGPSSFNFQMHDTGNRVVSVDPVYAFSKEEIEERILVAEKELHPQLEKNRDSYVWDRFGSPEDLIRCRLETMNVFLDDYTAGKKEGRYLQNALPELPFEDDAFDLSLCSHLLFNFSNLGYDFHLHSICEMARVSREARIFPVVDINGDEVAFRGRVVEELRSKGFTVEIIPVNYRVLKKADAMMKIAR